MPLDYNTSSWESAALWALLPSFSSIDWALSRFLNLGWGEKVYIPFAKGLRTKLGFFWLVCWFVFTTCRRFDLHCQYILWPLFPNTVLWSRKQQVVLVPKCLWINRRMLSFRVITVSDTLGITPAPSLSFINSQHTSYEASQVNSYYFPIVRNL